MKQRQRERLYVGAVQVIFVGALLGYWYFTSSRGLVPKLIVPKVPDTYHELQGLLRQPDTFHHIMVTTRSYLLAMASALTAGLTLGLVIGNSRYLSELLEPLLMDIYAVPIIMAYPLCILFFGIGPASKVAFSGFYAFFPIVIHTIKGIRGVDARLVRAAVTMGASPLQQMLKVKVPAAVPHVLPGIKLAAILGILSTIAGEMIASMEGVGNRVSESLQLFNTAEAYAWILIIMVMVSGVHLVLHWADLRYGAGANTHA